MASSSMFGFLIMRVEGFEPSHPNGYQNLNLARLPFRHTRLFVYRVNFSAQRIRDAVLSVRGSLCSDRASPSVVPRDT